MQLARGIDDGKVVPDSPTKSISAEDTFEHDVPLIETEPMIRRLAEKTWAARARNRASRAPWFLNSRPASSTSSPAATPPCPPSSCDELTSIALSLREKVDLGAKQRFRLVGLG
jgi:DNA polymerase-4